MKSRYAAIILSVVSVGVGANTLNYTVSDPGTVVGCKARPAGVGLCRKVSHNMLSGSTGVYDTNNGLFQINVPDQPVLLMKFSGNYANQSVCAEIHNPLIIEPLSYCQINANYHMRLNMTADFNVANRNIIINSDVIEDIGGFMSVTYTLKGAMFSPK